MSGTVVSRRVTERERRQLRRWRDHWRWMRYVAVARTESGHSGKGWGPTRRLAEARAQGQARNHERVAASMRHGEW